MRIITGSDHAGFDLKCDLMSFLEQQGHAVVDAGTTVKERCDYPDYAAAVAGAVASGEADWGLLVCGTGIGMAMSANKVRGIRAAVVSDAFSARATRLHNDANVLCLGERVVGAGLAREILSAWLAAEYEGGRHQARIDKMMALEG
jgi:ribose 5-phosphate isomerase B